jgi:hypothetical protein
MINNRNKKSRDSTEQLKHSCLLLQAVCRLCNIFFTFQHTFAPPRTSFTRQSESQGPDQRTRHDAGSEMYSSSPYKFTLKLPLSVNIYVCILYNL